MKTIGDILASAQYGTSKKAHDAGSGIPVLRMGNVSYAGELDTTALKFIELGSTETAELTLRSGDLLFNRTNSKELVGKTGIWDGRFPAGGF